MIIVNTLITSGQKESVIRVVVDAVRKGMDAVIDELSASGTINTANLQRVLAQGDVLAGHLIAEAKAKMTELAEQIVGYLKLISGSETITIGETDGTSTTADASDVFTGWVDPDFVNYGTNVKGQPTKETPVQVFEMIKNGTFAQIFGGFGENLDRLCLSQDQIICFVKNHSEWLRKDGYGTFFLFKENGECFVANVYWRGGRLGVYAYRLSRGDVWSAERRHRVVVPQL